MSSIKASLRPSFWFILLAVIIALVGLVQPALVRAQQPTGAVQTFSDQIEPDGRSDFYLLPNLQTGDVIYAYARGTSGNFDPLLILAAEPYERGAATRTIAAQLESEVAAGRDPLDVMVDIGEQYFLAWDDDSGDGYDAALSFAIETAGDYVLGIDSTFTGSTYGDYELIIGLNDPQVLGGNARPTGDEFAFLDLEWSQPGTGTQELTGTVTAEGNRITYDLAKFVAGDTLYVYAEGTSGDLKPNIQLLDFGRKLLRNSNAASTLTQTTLEYTFSGEAENYTLIVDGNGTVGDYRLLVGNNDPAVLSGQAETGGRPPILEPIVVYIGVQMDQISSVDQKAENFGVVANFRFDWTDPALAFNPESCQCSFKAYPGNNFNAFLSEVAGQWPEFAFFNQQGNRWTQNRYVVVYPDGRATYEERFTTTFQAPDFDFRKFPFDTQEFYIRVDSLYPENFYVYDDLPGYSKLGEQLGEEEWRVLDYSTILSSEDGNSRFSFRFTADRHLEFYILRIFVPIMLIIMVTWITFFLKDYGKRIDVTSANLLLFIAFNFTISGDLPRLGYLTFMDTLLIGTFTVSAVVILFNVILKRLEQIGKEDLARKLDTPMIWLYPLGYLLAGAIVFRVFFG